MDTWCHPEPSELEKLADTSGWVINKLEVLDTGFFWAWANDAAGPKLQRLCFRP